MKKAATVIVIVLISVMMLVMFFSKEKSSIAKKPQVTVSTFALYDVSKKLLHNIADVSMLIPFGQDIHTYEMTPQERIRIEQSTLFIYSGAGLEPWMTAFQSHPNAIDMSQFVLLREVEDYHGVSVDPHYWLNISNMISMTQKLRELFKETFAKELSQQITTNAVHYIKMLQSLDDLYKRRLAACHRDTIVVAHNAYGYLADRYGFHVMTLSGFSPDVVPSAKDLARLSDLVHEKGVSTLFSEPYSSDRLIKSVAAEAHARVDTLQPLANITQREALEMRDYQLMMQLNLKKLYNALECQ
ncbi:MAG: metal ABC transporter substrate-binding protein [Campylobacterota bacterium]|nr:metal ABC transporter substrate-binding protein [Campylobacterota bacterium]